MVCEKIVTTQAVIARRVFYAEAISVAIPDMIRLDQFLP